MTPSENTYAMIDEWCALKCDKIHENDFIEQIRLLSKESVEGVFFITLLTLNCKNISTVKALLQNFECLTSPDYGDPGLHHLAIRQFSDRPEIVNILCENGVSPTYRWINGWTALHYAVVNNKPKMLAELVKYANVDSRAEDVGEPTPLMEAASMGMIDCAIVLLDAGANVLLKSTDTGETAKELAKRNGNYDLAEIL